MAEEERESNSNRDQNPRKAKNPKDHLPSLSNCQSCSRHFAPKPQTLTSLKPLDSQWRIVLLCNECLRLVKSGAKCSYCFSEILKPESFVCVDCCPLPPFRSKCPRTLFTKFAAEELMQEAATAKEKALKKAMDGVSSVVVDPVVRDEDLALQLHLAMNGSRRISRSSRSMSLDRSLAAKKIKQYNGCTEKVEFCGDDKGFLDSCDSSADLSKELKKENNGCNSNETSVKEEQGSCSDKVDSSSEDHRKTDVWITYQRGSKSKGVGCQGKSPEKNKQMLNGMGVGEICSESQQISGSHSLDRYAMKYIKRKPILKNVSHEGNDFNKQAT
ncbi:uncharacterized protein A4U43_C04F7610 [Asparagus officinalis]|uniref:Uncharacterized protein n=1 Tax=Asparagus officinalis TaxID=4686 RepID=A0A5P1F3Y9_ASPOF|nr:uncharacterized protein LOC109836827 [Asparagus officinalis]ONK71351.1 uncharacterized protein A4U43_C04F7610 [Asparagus officinalis]